MPNHKQAYILPFNPKSRVSKSYVHHKVKNDVNIYQIKTVYIHVYNIRDDIWRLLSFVLWVCCSCFGQCRTSLFGDDATTEEMDSNLLLRLNCVLNRWMNIMLDKFVSSIDVIKHHIKEC